MGQPPGEFESRAWLRQPIAFVDDADAFTPSNAFAATVALSHGTAAPRIRARVLSVTTHRDAEWRVDGASLRVELETAEGRRFLYAKRLDMATGPGPQRLIDEELFGGPHDLAALAGDGRLLYADTHLKSGVDPRGGDVVVLGGGASSAWNVELAAKGGATVLWIARSGKTTNMSNLRLQEEISYLGPRVAAPGASLSDNIRHEELQSFGDAMLARNVGKGGAFELDGVTRVVGTIERIRPSPTMPRKVEIAFTIDVTGAREVRTVDRVIVSYGQDANEPGGVFQLLRRERPTLKFVDDKLVALETAGGAIRILGAAMWIPSWFEALRNESERRRYRTCQRLQQESLAPHSRGIATSINMTAWTIPMANRDAS
jgi:hypothetical protein